MKTLLLIIPTVAFMISCKKTDNLIATSDSPLSSNSKTNQDLIQKANYPFPQHTVYATGSIKPNNYTQSQLDNQVKNFYDKWKERYIVQGCVTNQYYIWYNDLGYDGNNICVSEGQGYGMVITAIMAGYDANAKKYFDGLYRWYKAHPSNINPVLMNWRQKKQNCASNGNDAATDGDEDIGGCPNSQFTLFISSHGYVVDLCIFLS